MLLVSVYRQRGGSVIFISESFEGNISAWRAISVLIELYDFKINLVSIYAPTALTDKKTFFNSLHEFFIPADGLIIAGDFNCYKCDLDKFVGNVSRTKYLSDFCSVFNFVFRGDWFCLPPSLYLISYN